MKKEYWDVSDEQLIEKTGHNIDHWIKILTDFDARNKKSNDAVALLQNEHNVPRYWARTMTTLFLKSA
jgi:hypothetical protein